MTTTSTVVALIVGSFAIAVVTAAGKEIGRHLAVETIKHAPSYALRAALWIVAIGTVLGPARERAARLEEYTAHLQEGIARGVSATLRDAVSLAWSDARQPGNRRRRVPELSEEELNHELGLAFDAGDYWRVSERKLHVRIRDGRIWNVYIGDRIEEDEPPGDPA